MLNIDQFLYDLIRPRLLVCIAGSYVDGSEHCLEAGTARSVIGITRTNTCVINLPVPPRLLPQRIVPLDDMVDAYADRASIVPMLNTSRATSAKDALYMIERTYDAAADLCEILFQRAPLVKLEILDHGLSVRNDEIVSCVRAMPMELRLRTIPIFTPSATHAVVEALALGCPAVRILSGKIGQQTGVLSIQDVAAAISKAFPVPVILEGGIVTPTHLEDAQHLGASAVLINSGFTLAADPIGYAQAIRRAADRIWAQVEEMPKDSTCFRNATAPQPPESDTATFTGDLEHFAPESRGVSANSWETP